MLTFACVWADKETYGPEYVNILYDMLRRNLPFGTEGKFICYTDFPDELDPGIDKRPWHYELEDEAHYLRLDCCIIRPLDGVLKGEALVYAAYDGSFPEGAHLVVFPDKKPHECDGWVKHVWKIGGGTTAEMTFIPNVAKEELSSNILSALKRNCRWFEPVEAHDRIAVIVGGGPSLKDDLALLGEMGKAANIFALNGVPAFLDRHGIKTDYHVMLDAHPNCLHFVSPGLEMTRYYASQCHPAVLEAAGDSLVCWHGGGEAMTSLTDKTFKHLVGGGSTGATRAIVLAYGLGYRKFHLFGMDSSFDGDAGHAYSQPDHDKFLQVTCGDETFKTTAQLLGQAEDFKVVAPHLMAAACEITVHGKGLLRAVAAQMAA